MTPPREPSADLRHLASMLHQTFVALCTVRALRELGWTPPT